ncbi:hypothetical protein [uncultured Streptococcus sp.]|uniref:hypothetical protein n=1 Tax=uncultured Streptococcus sp. TaxID=83427 RepID=UPI0028D5D930|nr:hypothetical protein [uncultured Streptococcus sp.]
MGDYFSPQKQGGQINSMIANQDSLASIYAVEQLYDKDMFNFNICIEDFSIQCETDDDLCIVNPKNKIFIQLKTASLTNRSFYQIMDHFLESYKKSHHKENYFVIATFSEFKIDGKNFKQRLDAYRQILNDPNEVFQKKNDVKQELLNDFNLNKYSAFIDMLCIDSRPLLKDNKDVTAVFSRYLRLAYGLKDHKERIINEIYEKLLKEFEQARRTRGYVTKDTIETIIGKYLVKDTAFDKFKLLSRHKKVDYGYVKKEVENFQLIKIEEGCSKAIKNIFHDWRQTYKKEFWKSIFAGAKPCLECGHPMNANLNGLRGIACPDCGYSPFVTIFSACNCGHYELIKSQPELDETKIFKYINEFYTVDRKCSKCNTFLSDEYFEFRVVMLPLPYPFESYKNIDKIRKNRKS